MEMFRPYGFDKGMFALALVLLTVGLVMVFSASGIVSDQKYNQPFHFLIQQVMGAVAGLILIFVMISIKKPFYQHPAFILGLLVVTFGLLVACFLMPTIARTNRWIVLPGLRFQPSELAKISLILFLAWYLERRKEKIHELPVLLVPLGIVFVFVLLILKEPDFGTALLIFVLCALVLFLGGVRMKYFGLLALLALPVFAYYLFSASYRLDRVLAFVSPGKNLQDLNFQVTQSKLALGAGGVLGASIGEGVQKLGFLPYPHTDFIFAVIGEEVGFVGALATVILFALLFWRGIVISMQAPNLFSQLTAAGLTLLLGIQALLNITVVLGLGPAKGIPLPFLSYGRSSLVCNLVVIGILLHISQRKELNAATRRSK